MRGGRDGSAEPLALPFSTAFHQQMTGGAPMTVPGGLARLVGPSIHVLAHDSPEVCFLVCWSHFSFTWMYNSCIHVISPILMQLHYLLLVYLYKMLFFSLLVVLVGGRNRY